MSTFEFQQHLVSLRQHLYYFALGLTHDRETAQDLMQESMLRALNNRDKFRDNTNFKAWLYTITKNTFINGHRRDKRTNALMDRVERERNTAMRVGTPASTESSLLMSELQRALGTLEDIFRRPFEMHHDGFKYQEIAEQLGIPVGTVKSRIHQARHRLMGLLTD
ncbi:MAG: RNA polymerase sigma factor [Flavobacteriales bacterium]